MNFAVVVLHEQQGYDYSVKELATVADVIAWVSEVLNETWAVGWKQVRIMRIEDLPRYLEEVKAQKALTV